MKELVEKVPGFELTTELLIKHFKNIPIKIRYDIVEESFDNRWTYRDLILYIPSGNTKDLYNIDVARNNFVDEMTEYPGSFMGDYETWCRYSEKFKKNTVIAVRKYNDETKKY